MEKKTIIIEVETAEGVKSVDRLTAKFDEIYGELLPLTGAIGELEDQLYQMALAGEQNTKAFKDVTDKVGQLKRIVQETDLATDAASKTLSNKMVGALGGVASGFSIAQGAMGAFGTDSKKVEEALLKVQSAMAIAQGIQGFKEALPDIKAFGSTAVSALAKTTAGQWLLNAAQAAGAVGMKIVNAVMNANPILLIIGGITALVGAFALFSSSADDAKEKQKALNEAQERAIQVMEAHNRKIDERVALEKELKEALTGSMKDQENQIRLMEAYGADAVTIQTAKQKMLSDKLAEFQNAEFNSGRAFNAKEKAANIQNIKDTQTELQILSYQFSKDQQAKDDAAEEKRKQKARENAEKLKAEKQKTYEEEVALDKKRREDLLAEDLFYESESEKGYEREKQGIADSNKLKEEARIAELEGISFVNKVKEEKRLEDEAADKVATEKKIALEKDVRNAKIQMASDAIGVIGELANAFAGKSEAQQRKAFNINKAASIAQATISTYQAAQSAYASQMTIPSPDAPIRGAVAAGIAIASGIAKVAVIAKTQFGGGGGGGGGGGDLSSTAPTPSMPTPANFNVVGNSGTNQLMQGLQNQPIKAYVVGGDVTTAQNLDRNKITTASI